MRISTAGWSLPRADSTAFPAEGSQLTRYAQVMNAVEINSSFYRPHREATYRRWAAETPAGFRFSVKLPKAITHEARLRDPGDALQRFLGEAGALGEKLAVLLMQLPPSLAFEPTLVSGFSERLRHLHAGAVVCEPRHASWFTPEADEALIAAEISRVAADPARWPAAAVPGGWLGPQGDGVGAVLYHRWHGSPRVYWSSYEAEWLSAQAVALKRWPRGAECWAVFDNTASGAALPNALTLQALWAGS